MFKQLTLLACGLSVLALAGCNNSAQAPPAGESQTTTSSNPNPAPAKSSISIALIPKGTTHIYWKSVEAGGKKAADEAGAKLIFKGPLKESDRAGQIGIVDQFASEGISAIVLAPLDDTALVKPVKSAAGKKIPVVIIDSALKGTPGKDFASFVATDNKQGGILAGERLAKLLGGKGKAVMLRYAEGSASTNDREEGFLSVMKKNPGITMISDNRYGGATSGESKAAAMNMVDQLREADGIFTPNESSTFGMLLALRQSSLAGKKKFVGFDSSLQLIEGLNKDEINALVVQNPVKMGYEGVKTALAAIKGKKVPATIDTGVAVVDKTNINTPDIKTLVGG